MMASITFGVIDALNFFFVEEELNNYWKSFPNLDENTIPILNGGISAAISIVLAFYVEEFISARYKVISHPAIEALGVIIGTVGVIVMYKIYTKINAVKTK